MDLFSSEKVIIAVVTAANDLWKLFPPSSFSNKVSVIYRSMQKKPI